ncbi:MAG TPA: acetyl-CoA carboxylase biotin carboxyl carrier protein [Bryobacteraceae bacterium]|jgi:acetyl-CoA carboxylase biotin carboxyl carrier protein
MALSVAIFNGIVLGLPLISAGSEAAVCYSIPLMNVDEIRELIKLATETGIAELEVQRGQDRVRIRRAGFVNHEITLGAPAVPSGSSPATVGAGAGVPAASLEPAREHREPPADPNLVLIKSPIVGTFYEAPSPDAAPFVRVGDRVQPGKVLCIIESMKLMNEIEAEMAGVIESQLVRNGQPVEYGEALFAIRAV